MKTFKHFLQLSEASLSDIKRMHINRGHSPDEVEDVITRANQAKKNGAQINLGADFKQVKAAVETHEQKQQQKSDIDVIHHDPQTGVTIKRVNTKDACVKTYGHGRQYSTKWCVAANSKENAFDEYGKSGDQFFSVHHKDPKSGKETVYGIHEAELGTIRDTEDNKVPIKNIHPHILKALATPKETKNVSIVAGNPYQHSGVANKQEEHEILGKVINRKINEYPHVNDDLDFVAQIIHEHPQFGNHESHITTALRNEEPLLRQLAAEHPKFGTHPDHFEAAFQSKDPHVKEAAKKKLGEILNKP